MPTHTREEAAARAGAPVEDVNRYVELRLLAPADGDRFSDGDIRRITVIRTMAQSGIPLEGLVQALGGGHGSLEFLDSPLYGRLAMMSRTTFRQLAEQTGLPVELVMVIREAVGGGAPEPDDLVREDELHVVPFLELAASEGVPAEPTERLLRVIGDGMRRIGESQALWWQAEIESRFVARGTRPGDLGEATLDFGIRLSRTYDEALQAIQRAHEARTWTKNILDGVEAALHQAGIYSRTERVPAMCFLDITGYTRLTQERGDAAAADLASTFSRMVQRTSVQHHGKAVKWLGDGVMFYFAEPGPGVEAALAMVDGVADAGLPPAHVGLHAGPVLFQEGDYFGQTVNIAARIADYARPGEVLVSQAVVEASPDVAAAFTEIGPVELKGVSETTRLHVARRPA